MTERLHFHFSLSCIGEGNGNPLQCSCLENPRDRGAWWAAVYGVAQSQTRLKRLSSSSSSPPLYAFLVTQNVLRNQTRKITIGWNTPNSTGNVHSLITFTVKNLLEAFTSNKPPYNRLWEMQHFPNTSDPQEQHGKFPSTASLCSRHRM